MSDLSAIFVIAALVLVNGLFVAAEFAIVGVPRAVMERRVREGQRLARVVLRILRDPLQQDRYITTAQLVITATSVGLGIFGEQYLSHRIEDWLPTLGLQSMVAVHGVSSALAVAVLTYFHIVIGEMIPKSVTLHRPERIAPYIVPVVLFVKNLCFPIVWALNMTGVGLLRLMGVRRHLSAEEHFHSAEDLQMIVEESQEEGLLRRDSGRVLLDLFEFGELTAAEVMVPRVSIRGIAVDASPEEQMETVRSGVHTRYPVYRDDLDHIIGVVHIKDILRQLVKGEPLRVEEPRPVPFVPEAAPLDAVLAVMQRERTHMAVVMDEHGGTAGLLTIEDLFEELVGDIEESLTEEKDFWRDPQGTLHVKGTLRVEEVGELLDCELEHDEVDSVSGLVLTLLNRPARVGDIVTFKGVEFRVTAIEGHGVKECAVVRVTDEEE